MKNDSQNTGVYNHEHDAIVQGPDTTNDEHSLSNEPQLDEHALDEGTSQVPQSSAAVIEIPRSHLRPHPRNREIFRPASPEKKAQLREDLHLHGQVNPLVVTGDDCASAPNTILAGEERYEASGELGWAHLRCVVIHKLTAEKELEVMVAHNRADLMTREYTQEDIYRMEKAARDARVQGRRQGQRSDLKPELLRGRFDRQEAQKNNTSTNALRKRQKVYESSVSTPDLKSAVNNKDILLNPAGGLIYDVERAFRDRDLDDPSVLQDAQREVNRRLDQHIASKRTGRPKKQSVKSNETAPTSEPAENTHSTSAPPVTHSGEESEATECPLTPPTGSVAVSNAPSTPAVLNEAPTNEQAGRLTVEQLTGIIRRQPLEAIDAMSKYAETLPDDALAQASHPTMRTAALALRSLMTLLQTVQGKFYNDSLKALEESD